MLQHFRLNRARIALLHDLAMAALSFPLALYLRLGEFTWVVAQDYLVNGALIFAAIAAPAFWYSRMYRGVWRYASTEDLIAITKAVTLAILIFIPVLFMLTRLESVPRSLPFIHWFVLTAMLGGPRFFYRIFKDRRMEHVLARDGIGRTPILLIGAGDEAELFIREQGRNKNAPYRVVGVVDDKGGRVGREIHGVPVKGTLDQLNAVLDGYRTEKPQRLVLTHRRLDGARVRTLLELCERRRLTLSRLPSLSKLKTGVDDEALTKPIDVADLLGRPQAVLELDAMATLIAGKRVLVTGAGGSIGGELARQLCGHGPASICLLDSSEFLLYQIDLELSEKFPDIDRRAVLADVRDAARIREIFQSVQPELVFHAAALKHVPIVELNPAEGILTNAVGSRIVADSCRAAGVGLMVQISTDKAVNPTNVMGATKRLAESYCQALDLDRMAEGDTRFVTVRFGNVLGSTGSVVPLFQRQIAAGGPVTVTHPDVTRYFMTVREAVELVLQASAMGAADAESRGRIYVLDMGEPVRIADLAKQMIRLAGYRPDDDIRIVYSGLRPGEKLHEELLHNAESVLPTAHPALTLAQPRTSDAALLGRALDEMEDAARERREQACLDALHRLIPEFVSETKPAAKAAQ